MKTEIIIILCEGPHDVAFLYRILSANGIKSNGKLMIKEFPKPINDLLKTEVTKTNVDDINIHEVRDVLLPYKTMNRDNNFFLLYSMGGDSQIISRQKLLAEISSFIPKENEISSLPENTNLSIIYFLDSDKNGISNRIEKLNDEIYEVLSIKPFVNHKEIFKFNRLKLGAFIITGADNENGKLEDILLPIMTLENEVIFDNAKSFIDINFDIDRLVKKFDNAKSLIGIVGQLQISGASNSVCIDKSDYISEDKIKVNTKCIEIFTYIDSFT